MNVSAAATDAASGTLSYTATALPSGLSINSSTGAITGTITQAGSWQTTVTASDGTYSNTADVGWTVNGAITITDQGDQTNASAMSCPPRPTPAPGHHRHADEQRLLANRRHRQRRHLQQYR